MTDIAGSYITIQPSNITNEKTVVRQLIDVVQSDIASASTSNTRKSYEVFISGSNNQNITSSLFQTVFDQDFTLGTANPLLDITMGSLTEEATNGTITVNGLNPTLDEGGKLIGFDDSTLMMREKTSIYRQFAQNLLGDANASFFVPHSATSEQTLLDDNSNALTRHKKIRGAIFICFRRLFTRDNIQKGSLGIKVNKSVSKLYSDFTHTTNRVTADKITNINTDPNVSATLMSILDDSLSNSGLTVSPESGEFSTIKNSDGHHVGCIFYDSGIIVLDVERVFDPDQTIRGLIKSVRSASAASSIDQQFLVYGRKNGEAANQSLERYYYPVYTTDDGVNRNELSSFIPVDSAGADSQVVNLYYPSDASQFTSTLSGVEARPNTTRLPFYNGLTTPSDYYSTLVTNEDAGETLHNGNLYPSLWTSGSIDEVLDHICLTRFGQGETTSSMTFKNETFINSSFIFCRAAPSQLNYSTNPTYTDSNGNIIALNTAINGSTSTFSYVTTIGLYNAAGELLAVAKTSRPIEKNSSTDLSIRIRLDY